MSELIGLERNVGQGSKDAWVIVRRSALDQRAIDPVAFPMHCIIEDDRVRIRVSPTSYRYLAALAPDTVVDEAVRAIPFAALNGRPRIWTTDLALLHGARTSDQVRDWERQQGLRSQAKDVGALRLPPENRPGAVFFTGSDEDLRAHLETVFGTEAFYLEGTEVVLELPLMDNQAMRPRPTGETVHVWFMAPASWTIQAPEGGSWWHVVPDGAERTLCTIALSNWTTPARRNDEHRINCPWCRARMVAIEIAAPPSANVATKGSAPTLHEELARLLRVNGDWMTTEELATAVNSAGCYRKRDGSPVTAFQVHGRTRNYPDLFERNGSRVRTRKGHETH